MIEETRLVSRSTPLETGLCMVALFVEHLLFGLRTCLTSSLPSASTPWLGGTYPEIHPRSAAYLVACLSLLFLCRLYSELLASHGFCVCPQLACFLKCSLLATVIPFRLCFPLFRILLSCPLSSIRHVILCNHCNPLFPARPLNHFRPSRKAPGAQKVGPRPS